jgi:ABC-2 type transport system ATP-binding protein
MEKTDFVSARKNDFCVDVMVSDRVDCKKKYAWADMEKTNLEEIMLFYVNKEKKEWS